MVCHRNRSAKAMTRNNHAFRKKKKERDARKHHGALGMQQEKKIKPKKKQ